MSPTLPFGLNMTKKKKKERKKERKRTYNRSFGGMVGIIRYLVKKRNRCDCPGVIGGLHPLPLESCFIIKKEKKKNSCLVITLLGL